MSTRSMRLVAGDGDRVFVDEQLLKASVNVELIRGGLAYAVLYTTMPLALIHRMRQLVTAARAADAGFWPKEHLTTAARLQLQMHSVAELSTTGGCGSAANRCTTSKPLRPGRALRAWPGCVVV